MKNNWIITILLVIIVGGGAFFAGMQFQKSQRPGMMQFANGANGQFRMRFGNSQNGAVRPVRGQVVSADSNSLTVKMTDGSTKIVLVTGNTMLLKSTSAALSDIKTGDTVMVFGAANADGSVTAQNVQINPPVIQRPTPTGKSQ